MTSIGSRRVSARSVETPWLQNTRCAHLLSKFKGLCFRCLARDHQAPVCCNPIKCWICCRCGHTSKVCPSRKSSSSSTSHKTSTTSDRWHHQTGRVSPTTTSQHCPPMGQVSRPDSTHQQQARRQDPFLSRMHGLCFNCLAQDHRVAQCRNSVRCWWCHKSRHICSGCPSRHRTWQGHGEIGKM